VHAEAPLIKFTGTSDMKCYRYQFFNDSLVMIVGIKVVPGHQWGMDDTPPAESEETVLPDYWETIYGILP
jgi:hypothetical protein